LVPEDAESYANAVALYLGFAVSRLADYGCTISTWMPDPKNEGIRNTFARQAIPMTWDYAEANPFSQSSGNWLFMIRGIGRVLDANAAAATAGVACQANAETAIERGQAVCTDPPYYDNIGYVRPIGLLLRLATPLSWFDLPQCHRNDADTQDR